MSSHILNYPYTGGVLPVWKHSGPRDLLFAAAEWIEKVCGEAFYDG